MLFAVGLLAASLLGLGVVPADERLHDLRGVRLGDRRRLATGARRRPSTACWRSSSGSRALFVMIPGLPLIQVMFAAQVINGLLLPFILVFVMLLSADRRLMGAAGQRLRARLRDGTCVLSVVSY